MMERKLGGQYWERQIAGRDVYHWAAVFKWAGCG